MASLFHFAFFTLHVFSALFFVCFSSFLFLFCMFFPIFVHQVLKPLSDNFMEDNIRQTVTNSIKAGLTEQVTQASRLKTDWQSISPAASFYPMLVLYNDNSKNKHSKPKFTVRWNRNGFIEMLPGVVCPLWICYLALLSTVMNAALPPSGENRSIHQRSLSHFDIMPMLASLFVRVHITIMFNDDLLKRMNVVSIY